MTLGGTKLGMKSAQRRSRVVLARPTARKRRRIWGVVRAGVGEEEEEMGEGMGRMGGTEGEGGP